MAIEKIICPDCGGEDFRHVKTDIVCQGCRHVLTDEEIDKLLKESYEQFQRGEQPCGK
ncbi:MAG: hypothetical protein N2513_10505 [Deltaproteobacteria bacterium]|nr:hypothetical protein [Deltaproteobacteria bacterium]